MIDNVVYIGLTIMQANVLGVQKAIDPQTEKLVALSEAGRRQPYLDKMTGGDNVTTLRKLVERCLDDDPNKRPPILEVKKTIEPMVVSVILIFCVCIKLYNFVSV